MRINWVTNGIFSALVTASFYFTQLTLEASNLTRVWTLLISVTISAIGVGVLLRYVVTSFPFRFFFVRQLFLPSSVLEGLWLEVLDRHGEQHYSIVRFQYDRNGTPDPFSMLGHSFYPDGRTHSEWETRLLRIKNEASSFWVEYIYVVDTPAQTNRPEHGYGESRFTEIPAKKNHPISGRGYYLAAEESQPFNCTYQLYKIDDRFKQSINGQLEKLDTISSMQSFILLADIYYKDKAKKITLKNN